jgi:hypothetical protein
LWRRLPGTPRGRPFQKSYAAGTTLIDRTALAFEVSTEATMVRLAKLAYLTD